MKLKLMEFVANHTILSVIIAVFGVLALLPIVFSLFGVALGLVFTIIKLALKLAFFGAIVYGGYRLGKFLLK